MKNDKLKPCPFCGSEDVKQEDLTEEFITCNSCLCLGPTADRSYNGAPQAEWNTRTEPTKEKDFVDVRELQSRNLKHAYSGVLLISDDGEELGICSRDSGFEFQYNDIWYEAKEGILKPLWKAENEEAVKLLKAFLKIDVRDPYDVRDYYLTVKRYFQENN